VRSELQVVGEASDGLEAVQKAKELQPDLICLDIGMPILNGIEAAHRISKLVPAAKILFISQDSDPEVIAAALGNGAKGYVFKLDAVRELLLAVESVLRGQRFISPGVTGIRATPPSG
jgi:DNA-binding NarL/FixJ family response regulator